MAVGIINCAEGEEACSSHGEVGVRGMDVAAIARGRALASMGDPAKGIPACRECHGPVPTRRNPFYPTLAGQYEAYIRLQLKLFQQDRRGGSSFSHLMHPTAERLTPEQVREVAAYYATLR